MKQEKQVVLTEYVHSDLDGKSIPDAIKFLENLSKLYDCTKLYLDWDGDKLNLIGTRLEYNLEEQNREQQEAYQKNLELAELARLKAKYEKEPDLSEIKKNKILAAMRALDFV